MQQPFEDFTYNIDAEPYMNQIDSEGNGYTLFNDDNWDDNFDERVDGIQKYTTTSGKTHGYFGPNIGDIKVDNVLVNGSFISTKNGNSHIFTDTVIHEQKKKLLDLRGSIIHEFNDVLRDNSERYTIIENSGHNKRTLNQYINNSERVNKKVWGIDSNKKIILRDEMIDHYMEMSDFIIKHKKILSYKVAIHKIEKELLAIQNNYNYNRRPMQTAPIDISPPRLFLFTVPEDTFFEQALYDHIDDYKRISFMDIKSAHEFLYDEYEKIMRIYLFMSIMIFILLMMK